MDRSYLLRKLFKFNPVIVRYLRLKYQRLLSGLRKPVSIHFRLGSDDNPFKPPPQPTFDWYRSVIASPFGNIDAVFVLFTDNVPLLKLKLLETNILAGRSFEIVEEDFAHSLALMTMCKHHIAANSKLSYWGITLDPKQPKGGVTIFPAQFFNSHRVRPVPFTDWIVRE